MMVFICPVMIIIMFPGQFEKKMVPVIYKNAKKIHAISKSLADALVDLKLADTKPIRNSKRCKY